MYEQGLQRERIARQAETADDTETNGGKFRFMPTRLPCMHVRDMYFADRGFDGGDGIPERNRRMRVRPRIKDDPRIIVRFMERVNQFAFMVGLDERQLNILRGGEQ
jgi:hypothetical protein